MGGKAYLLSRGDFSAFKQVHTPEGQLELLEKLSDTLRNLKNVSASTEEQLATVKEFSDPIHSFFIDFNDLPEDTSHLELFLNPSELGLIPFELLLNENGTPYFVNQGQKQLVLTRNYRRDQRRHDLKIPVNPRVLFVHSLPRHPVYDNVRFPEMPHDKHEFWIKKALKHFNPDESFEQMDNPTFEEFKAEVERAAKSDKPYTHIHLLAHGALIFDRKRPSNFEYGIAFRSDAPLDEEYKATSAAELKALFDELEDKHLPYVVNYMICDGANFTNGTKPNKNPVQATFSSGVPVVIGSQFPLTMDGSIYITKELYKRMFQGDDLREILGDIRTGLYAKPDKYAHDWVSLVTYMDVPRNYEYDLLDNKTKRQLRILNSYRDNQNTSGMSRDDFIALKVKVGKSMESLHEDVMELNDDGQKEKLFLEYSGLLASSFKRLAEIEFNEAIELKEDTSKRQLEHLANSRTHYKNAANQNLSHHWTAVQYLSLQTVLEGNLDEMDTDLWYAARLAALAEIKKNPKEYWAYGTLIELLFISPDPKESFITQIIDYANKLVEKSKEAKKIEPLISTTFQLKRYKNWWKSPPYKIPENLLIMNAKLLDEVLDIIRPE